LWKETADLCNLTSDAQYDTDEDDHIRGRGVSAENASFKACRCVGQSVWQMLCASCQIYSEVLPTFYKSSKFSFSSATLPVGPLRRFDNPTPGPVETSPLRGTPLCMLRSLQILFHRRDKTLLMMPRNPRIPTIILGFYAILEPPKWLLGAA
jgi:hypothetical protein